MLEKIDCSKTVSKNEYRERMPGLQRRLFDLQRACWDGAIGIVVVFEGWSASGKGAVIKKLTERLEPRAFEIHAVHEPRTHEIPLPWLYRFWVRLPSYGRLAVLDHGWHHVVAHGYVDGSMSEARRMRMFEDINSFERGLKDDRYEVVKFFMHITRDEQERRLEELQSDEATKWRVDAKDWEQNRSYEAHLAAAEELLARTETEWAPWTIVEAHQLRWARLKVVETLIERIEEELPGREGVDVPGAGPDGG